MTDSVLWIFPTMLWVGLQCVIVVFPGHTYLLSVVKVFRCIIYTKMHIEYRHRHLRGTGTAVEDSH